MAIPWLQLIKHAPTIVSLSREVLQRTRKGGSAPVAGAGGQMESLAADLQRQAEVLHALAGQLEGVTAVLAALRRALLLAVCLGAAAFLLAAAALVLALLG